MLRFYIADDVRIEFVVPEIRVGLWTRGKLAAVLVPKATIHENRDPVFLHENIWSARQVAPVQTIAETCLEQRLAHDDFGFCILGMHRLHHLGTRQSFMLGVLAFAISAFAWGILENNLNISILLQTAENVDF